MKNILVLNCGSSSIKFQLITTSKELIASDADECILRGVIEGLGGHSIATLELQNKPMIREVLSLKNHKEALKYILEQIFMQLENSVKIDAVGHRVVHGADKFSQSVLIDDKVIQGISDCIELAPLHNGANLKGIRAVQEALGGIPQVAVFDTAFHATIPEVNYLYAIPYQLYRRWQIRRYGFHGTSHRYVLHRYAKNTATPLEKTKIITIHLGNGCSACAIRAGESFETSMGFTPLEGLMMGTRSGDIDAGAVEHLMQKEGMTIPELDNTLNKQSGLLGISGLTNDMRELLDEERMHHDRRVSLAISMFCQRVKHYIGAYCALLNGVDALVFTGGIGENAAEVRERICADLDFLGIALDKKQNQRMIKKQEGEISQSNSKIKIWVIPTNEELVIARDTLLCL